MRFSLLGTMLLLALSGVATPAQKVSMETEGGIDTAGAASFSQYVFVDGTSWNALFRYVAAPAVQKVEGAIGPTIKLDKTTVKIQVGATSRSQAMVAGTLAAAVAGHSVFYIADSKFALRDGPNTLYQKLFVGLSRSGSWQARLEDLQVGRRQSFFAAGAEYRKKWGGGHVFVAPYYDFISGKGGVHAGIRR